MTTITLDTIKAEQNRLAAMIASFEAQAKTRRIKVPEAEIELKDGEHYAGIIVGKEGDASYHLVLLPCEAESINWSDAKSWAAGVDGELPNRREQALLYANLKDQFQGEWYWSCEKHASVSDYAWGQDFDSGNQDYLNTSLKLRARAVRRLPIE
jgi:hypothetical protein